MSLSPAELARLDLRVDVAQLEKLLASVPGEFRALALNGFVMDPDSRLAAVIGATDPTLDQIITSIMRDSAESTGAQNDE